MIELSEEQQGELAASLKGLGSDEAYTQEPAEAAQPDQTEEYEAPSESEASEEAPEVEMDSDEAGEEHGHSVPYARFSKVIAHKNQLNEEADSLRSEVERLKRFESEVETLKRYNAQPAAPQQEEESYEYDDDAVLNKRLKELESKVAYSEQEATIQGHMSVMEKEIAKVQEQYPDVDPVQILNHVQQNPDADIMQLAIAESSRISEMREVFIAQYLKENPNAAQAARAGGAQAAPDVPPEIRNQTSSAKRGYAGNKAPSTWEDAHSQAAEALKAAWVG